MADDDDFEALLREVDMATGSAGASDPSDRGKSIESAKKHKETTAVNGSDDADDGVGRFAWSLMAGAGGAGVGLVVGFFLWFLPWVAPLPMALGAGLGAWVAALVSGPPKWLSNDD